MLIFDFFVKCLVFVLVIFFLLIVFGIVVFDCLLL